jgi:hypothetical protein
MRKFEFGAADRGERAVTVRAGRRNRVQTAPAHTPAALGDPAAHVCSHRGAHRAHRVGAGVWLDIDFHGAAKCGHPRRDKEVVTSRSLSE